jgi:hypothetical protein
MRQRLMWAKYTQTLTENDRQWQNQVTWCITSNVICIYQKLIEMIRWQDNTQSARGALVIGKVVA